MAKVIPFKAVRPTRDKVGLIASRAYQSYSDDEVQARLNYNPYSFLHIVNPGYKYHKKIKGTERYQLVQNRYQEFKEEGIFVQDEQPCYYIYKIIDRNHNIFEGIIGAASIQDCENKVIKKHEETIKEREETFKEYLKTVGFNAEPVLMTYQENNHLAQIIKQNTTNRAEYEFTTTYRDTHYLWKINQPQTIEKIKLAFENCEALYIADGHHRTASSLRLQKELKTSNKNHTGQENYNYFMCYLIPETQLKISHFNRLIKDLNKLTKEEFLIALDENFLIENRGLTYYNPTKKHQFSMYLEGAFYSIQLRKYKHKIENALDDLDSQILYKKILQPLLNIQDLRDDSRINYIHAHQEMALVKSKIDMGDYQLGFGLKPATLEQLKEIANQNLKMPPKSTYIEPKLRSGITIFEF